VPAIYFKMIFYMCHSQINNNNYSIDAFTTMPITEHNYNESDVGKLTNSSSNFNGTKLYTAANAITYLFTYSH